MNLEESLRKYEKHAEYIKRELGLDKKAVWSDADFVAFQKRMKEEFIIEA